MTLTITGDMESRIKELQKLNNTVIYVGIPNDDAQMNMIALVNNDGKTIKPKKGKYLVVPATPEMIGKKSSDIPGLFKPKGKRVLAVQNGSSIKVLFYLLEQVVIPPRKFLENTQSKYSDDWGDLIRDQVQLILTGEQTADGAIKLIGNEAVKDMQLIINQFSQPKNSMLTQSLKGFNNPLIMTGKMMKSVIYTAKKVEGD